MTDEPTYVFTLSELRTVLVDIYLLGRSQCHCDRPRDNAEDCADGFLEAHGCDFQLESGQNREPTLHSSLDVPETGLRDDIESDKDDLTGFFRPEDPLGVG